jgi:hypothetical protein
LGSSLLSHTIITSGETARLKIDKKGQVLASLRLAKTCRKAFLLAKIKGAIVHHKQWFGFAIALE